MNCAALVCTTLTALATCIRADSDFDPNILPFGRPQQGRYVKVRQRRLSMRASKRRVEQAS